MWQICPVPREYETVLVALAPAVALLCVLLPDLALQLGFALTGLPQVHNALLARPRHRFAVACRWPL